MLSGFSSLRTKVLYPRRNGARGSKQTTCLSRKMYSTLHRVVGAVVGNRNAIGIDKSDFVRC
jgi:hypothetical protein